MPPAVTAAEFLKTIWGESQGFAELTAIGKQGVKSYPWTYPGAIDSLLTSAQNHNRGANVYMGVCLRREKWPRPSGRIGIDGKQIIEYRGTEANALSTWVVWTEFDFLTSSGEGHKGRVVDPEVARKWLAEFPLKPSIVVKSGGGIQVYWLLKEAATGDDLWRVKAINKALVEFFTHEVDGKKYGADTQSVDLARILRIPGSVNIKYTPHRPCEISWWQPETRYTLDDFDILPIHVEKPLLAAATQALAPQQPTNGTHQPVAAPPQGATPHSGPRAVPSIVLPQEAIDAIREEVQALWMPGVKHYMALRVAGMLAHANVAMESAVAIIKTVAELTNSDVEKRVKDVIDTYNSYVSGKEVAGRTSLEQLIDSDFPKDSKDKAISRVKKIMKHLPKAPKTPAQGGGGGRGQQEEADPDFQLPKIVKFDSRPARWTPIIVTPEGETLEATVETVNLMTFRLFQGCFFEETHHMLGEISQRRWKAMVGAAQIEVRETPKEARPEGAIETALDEFLSDARENPEPGVLTAFAGYDETDRFFKFATFKDFLKEQNIRIEDRSIFDYLKCLGFKNGVKRFGPKTQRLWMAPLGPGNGPKNGNGHGGYPPEPPEPEKPVQPPPGKPAAEPQLFADPVDAVAAGAGKDVTTSTVDTPVVEDF